MCIAEAEDVYVIFLRDFAVWEGLPLNFDWIGRALDEYRAISWKGMEYINVITVCLGRSLSILQRHGISRIIME